MERLADDMNTSAEAPTDASALLRLAPWPDATVHPDPKHTLKRKLESKQKVDADFDAHGKKRELEVPQTDYMDDGRLIKPLDEFINVRRLDPVTIQQFQLPAAANNKKKRKGTPSSNRNKRSKTSASSSRVS